MPKVTKLTNQQFNLMALKRFFSIMTLCLAIVACNKNYNSQISAFVPSVPDVPLPKDFEVDPTTGSFFDSAEGRIAETYAAGFQSPEEVKRFYKKTMPEFGWQEEKNADLNFTKEGETLVITPEKGQYLTTIKYLLKPTTN